MWELCEVPAGGCALHSGAARQAAVLLGFFECNAVVQDCVFAAAASTVYQQFVQDCCTTDEAAQGYCAGGVHGSTQSQAADVLAATFKVAIDRQVAYDYSPHGACFGDIQSTKRMLESKQSADVCCASSQWLLLMHWGGPVPVSLMHPAAVICCYVLAHAWFFGPNTAHRCVLQHNDLALLNS
jgi:hypothetical protein